MFWPSLLILFLHNGLPESTLSGWRMDEDADWMDAGEQARAGQGLCRASSGPWFLFHLPLLHLLASLSYLDFLFSGLQNYVAGVGPGANSINFVEELLQPPPSPLSSNQSIAPPLKPHPICAWKPRSQTWVQATFATGSQVQISSTKMLSDAWQGGCGQRITHRCH